MSDLSTVSGNTVFNNGAGITATGKTLVTNNSIYGQSGAGVYIADTVYKVLSNIIHDNATGIYSYSNGMTLIQGNIVYRNSGDGIQAERDTIVTGNTVYDNATGIALDYFSSAPVTNNLIYGNTNQGILVTYYGSPTIANNTIYQPAGDAIDVQNNSLNVSLRNNILWTQAGFDINVDPTSEQGFQSDYNDLYATGAGKLGSWQGQTFTTQQDWYYRIGQDQHSLTADPQFVNPAGPDGVLGFSTSTIGNPRIIDDSSASGFSTTGTWTPVTDITAENGAYLTAPAGDGSSVATWTFTGLIPGATYQVAAYWVVSYTHANDSPFSVYDGSQLISYTHDSQSPYTPYGPPLTTGWNTLGYFADSSGTLTVQLSNAAQGTVVADAVMLQQIQGNKAADDNFHLAAGSPAVDAGSPADPVALEPVPNGGRIDQGAFGGTAQATTSSSPQELQVLTPGPLDKLRQGQQETITWHTGGLYAPANYYSGAVSASGPLAYYRLGDASGTAAADTSGNGLNATYVGGVQLGQVGALPFDPDTAVTLDGSTGYVQLPKLNNDFTNGFSAEVWANPTSVSYNQSYLRFWQRRLCRQYHPVPSGHFQRPRVRGLPGRFAGHAGGGAQRHHAESMAAVRGEHGCPWGT